MSIGFAYDDDCLKHDNGSMVLDEKAIEWLEVDHAENAKRLSRGMQVMERSGVLDRTEALEVPMADEEQLLYVHTPEHVEKIREACKKGEVAWVGPEARVGKSGSWEAGLKSAGAAIVCADYVMEGKGTAYAFTRPPGHHSSQELAYGFCLFNNVAIAARHVQKKYGLKKIAILDWDVHHGNGTQAVFYDDPDVMFISIHQDGLYPADDGYLEQRGGPGAEGANLNIPMPAGSGDAGYTTAVNEVVIPKLEAFGPELIFLSSGHDAEASDPLGRMSVTTEGFRQMTQTMLDFADQTCDGHIVGIQEGGYSLDHLPFCLLATVEALGRMEPSFTKDPIELDVPTSLSEAERRAIDAAKEMM